MADDALAPFTAKLDRADESLRTFDEELAKVNHAKPLRLGIDVNFQTGWNTAHIDHADPLPPRLAVLVGESLYQGRSALEHLVWALVKANHKKPGHHNSFPIWQRGTTAKFLADTNRERRGRTSAGVLRGVAKQPRALIESLQPYHAPDPSAHFLSVLNRMARDDRHHALHGAYVGGRVADFQHIFKAQPGYRITEFESLLYERKALVKRTKLARFRVAPLTRQPHVGVDGQVPSFIAFGSVRGRFLVDVRELKKLNIALRLILEPFAEFL